MRSALPFLSVLFIFSTAHNVSGEENTDGSNPDTAVSPAKELVAAWNKELGGEAFVVRKAAEQLATDAQALR